MNVKEKEAKKKIKWEKKRQEKETRKRANWDIENKLIERTMKEKEKEARTK